MLSVCCEINYFLFLASGRNYHYEVAQYTETIDYCAESQGQKFAL